MGIVLKEKFFEYDMGSSGISSNSTNIFSSVIFSSDVEKSAQENEFSLQQ
jgi:hypothetical protein